MRELQHKLSIYFYIFSYFHSSADDTKAAYDFYGKLYDLKNEIKSIYDFSPGTTSNYKNIVPSGIKGICFIDVSNANVEDINYDDIKDIVGVLKDTGSDKNMFYSASAQVKQPDPIKIDKLKPKNNLVCKSTSRGILELDIENKGSFVEVS